MKNKELDILGYRVNTNYPDIPVSQKTIINTINPHSYCVAENDEDFQNALKTSDVLIPDGIGIVWAAKILKGQDIPRIAGADMHAYLLEQAEEHKLKVFYLGSSEETLEKIEQRISKEYSNIEVDSFSPPYKEQFSEADNKKMRAQVNAFKPDILFVGLTAPKQEKWVYQNEENLQANIVCSIGAVFDFYAGTVQRPGPIWRKLGLEWLPRLLKEPQRLWKRNFVSTPLFLFEILKEKVK